MAKSVEFDGYNRRYINAPEEDSDLLKESEDMFGFNNRVLSFTCWRPTPEELAEINHTGEIWMAVRCGDRAMQPHWVGSLSWIKQQCADMGRLWKSSRRMLEDKRQRPDDQEPA